MSMEIPQQGLQLRLNNITLGLRGKGLSIMSYGDCVDIDTSKGPIGSNFKSIWKYHPVVESLFQCLISKVYWTA